MTVRWLAALALLISGCTVGGGSPEAPPTMVVGAGELRLASFDSCDQALGDLRKALLPLVGPYGLSNGFMAADASAGGAAEAAPAVPGPASPGGRSSGQQDKASAPEHSGTNTHESGVDEPDLVKTDGKRIVTVVGGSLRVVDAASRTLAATLALPAPGGMDELLLFGDHALVIRRGGFAIDLPTPEPGTLAPGEPGTAAPNRPGPIDGPVGGSELLLVDLAGTPRVLATFAIDGSFVDARMVGQTVRVVTHSQPRLRFVYPTPDLPAADAQQRNREIVGSSSIEDWLPRYRLSRSGEAVQSGRVDCAAVARPASYSATSMLTVLTFDLGASTLGTGDPVTIVADGNIVYGTADSLYVASDAGQVAFLRGMPDVVPPPGSGRGGPAPGLPQERTELYKFDTSGTARPRHVASGAVPGSLLNQYSMSQHDGHLRVATTLGAWGRAATSESTVYVLAQRGSELTVVGKAGGLGKGERIYAVRFAGPVGYVVTFRQTDPLYVLDLRNPASPAVRGELKITGYSAYLHPAGDGRVLGVGQEATEEGRVQGTQVSLFDVSDPAAPRRVAQYHVPGGWSEVESDPHAFLYWAPTRTLVLPVATYAPDRAGGGGALVLRVGDASLDEVGRLQQPTPYGAQPPRRTLVVGDTLWTVSEFGAAAVGLTTLDTRGWVAFAS